MRQNERTKAQIAKTLNDCYSKAESAMHFSYLLLHEGFMLHEQNGKNIGFSINGVKYNYSDFGFTDKRFETIGPPPLTEEDFLLIEKLSKEYKEPLRDLLSDNPISSPKDEKGNPTEKDNNAIVGRENELNDIQEYEEMGIEDIEAREDDLDEIRGNEGEEKGIDEGLER